MNLRMDSLKIYELHKQHIHSIYSSRLKIQILLTLIHNNSSLIGYVRSPEAHPRH